MSSSSSSSSFHLFSATTLSSITKPFSPTSIHIFSSSITPHLNLSTTPTSINLFKQPTSSPQFARHFAIAASFKLDEGLSGEIEEEEETPNYSPDLKIYVGNLPWNVDSAELAGLFQRAGNVEMVEVVYDKGSGRSRGFGFVTMSSVKEVEVATRQFNGYDLDGRQLRVNAGPPPSKGESFFRGQRDGSRGDDGGRGGVGVKDFDNTNKVYVGNLAWSVDNLALETLFQDQGNVMEARVVYDRDSGRSKGFGFVTYGSMDEVNKAIDSLDGVNVDGRNIRVSVAEARQRPQF